MPLRSDPFGAYRQRGRMSWTVVGVYVFLIVIVLVFVRTSTVTSWASAAVVLLFLFFLFRYITTAYSINDTHLVARRFPGTRRVPLDTIRRIEYSSMRDLGPSSFIGSWGWRGRMWSPSIGHFDAVYTDPAKGILVTGDGVPLYISPNDLTAFSRELSRRARSYSGRLVADVGDPRGSAEEESPDAAPDEIE